MLSGLRGKAMSAGLLRRIFGVRAESRVEQSSAGRQKAVQARAKGRAERGSKGQGAGCGIEGQGAGAVEGQAGQAEGQTRQGAKAKLAGKLASPLESRSPPKLRTLNP